MRINEHQAVISQRITLVPYCVQHVPKYHEWMQDEELQKLTASEPLWLPEEYEMQQSWRQDADKLTFIVLTNDRLDPSSVDESRGLVDYSTGAMSNEVERMIGDINLFLHDDDPSDDEHDHNNDDGGSKGTTNGAVIGELELMIAETSHRGKRLGQAIVETFLWYITTNLNAILTEFTGGRQASIEGSTTTTLRHLRVKIHGTNVASLKLFKRLGFSLTGDGKANYFGEVELRMALEGLLKERVDGDGAADDGNEGTSGGKPKVVEYRPDVKEAAQ